MKLSKVNIYTAIIWGACMYALQSFLQNPDSRIQIIMSMGIAFLILLANKLLVTNSIYNNKILRYLIPILIMNFVLIPINILIAILMDYSFKNIDLKNYIMFNIIVFAIYMIQNLYHKSKINKQLKAKISALE